MTNEGNVLTVNTIQGLFFSLSPYLTVDLWNEFLDDQSLEHGDEVENFWIHPNENDFFETTFCDAMALLNAFQHSKDSYSVEHGYVVYDEVYETLKSFNDPCIFIQDHADDVGFWDWFVKKTCTALNDSVKCELRRRENG